MKQASVKLPSGEYLLAEVYSYQNPTHEDVLFPGNWQLLGANPTSLTEEEAGEIVNWLEIAGLRGWQNYLVKNDYVFPFNTATASIDSLAQSLGISKPYVILKNIEI